MGEGFAGQFEDFLRKRRLPPLGYLLERWGKNKLRGQNVMEFCINLTFSWRLFILYKRLCKR